MDTLNTDTSNTLWAIAFLIFLLWIISKSRGDQGGLSFIVAKCWDKIISLWDQPPEEHQEDLSFTEEVERDKAELVREYYRINGIKQPTDEELHKIILSAESLSEEDPSIAEEVDKILLSAEMRWSSEEDEDDDENYFDSAPKYVPPAVEKYWAEIIFYPVEARVQITYENSKGEKSNRIIQIKGYDGSPYLRAFCELRNQERIFRIDRIAESIDMETGGVIESLPSFLEEKAHQTPDYIYSKVFSTHLDFIKVLFYIGKADGRLQAAERVIIYAAIRKLADGCEIADKTLDRKFKQLPIPSAQAFKLAFGRLYKTSPKQARTAFLISIEILQTHKKRSQLEDDALTFMGKKLKL